MTNINNTANLYRKFRALLATTAAAALLSISAFAQSFPYASTPGSSEYPNADVLILSESTSFELGSNGLITEKVHKLEKILTYEGLDAVGDPKIAFNNDLQKLTIQKVRTYTPDGRIVNAKANSFNEMTPFELSRAPTYTAWRQMVVTKVGLEIGCVVETEYTLEDLKPWRKWLEGKVTLRDNEPTLEREVKVTVPVGTILKWHLFNAKAETSTSTSEGRFTSTWKLKNIPLSKGDERWNHESTFLPTLVFTTCPDWKTHSDEVGAAVNKALAATSPALEGKTDELVKNKSGALERLLRLQKYVAEDINTVYWPASAFNYAPRSAAEIYDSGYGIPLDKAVLLCSMLKHVGIEAAPAAWARSYHNGVDPSLVPCLSQLSGILVRAKVEDGVVWIDPSRTLSSRSHKDLVGVKYLPLLPGFDSLHTLPQMGAANLFDVSLNLTVGKDMVLSGKGSITLSGRYSPYYGVMNSADSQKSLVTNLLSGILHGAEATSVTVSELSEEKAVFHISFKAPSPDAQSGILPLSIGTPSVSLIEALPFKYKYSRELPLILNHSGVERMRLTLHFGEDFSPFFIPKALKVKGTAVSFKRSWKKHQDTLTMESVLDIPSSVIKAADYPAFRKAFTEAEAASNNTLLFRSR